MLHKKAKIFEISCGPGNITKYLISQRPDFNIYGIDLAPNMVRLAQENNPDANFNVMDSRDISSINQLFDAVLCGFCLPYLSKEDALKLIADTRPLLKKGGIFYISTMEDDYHKSGFQTSIEGDQVYIHYHKFKYLKSCLENHGFKVINVQRKQFPVESGQPAVTDLFIYAEAV